MKKSLSVLLSALLVTLTVLPTFAPAQAQETFKPFFEEAPCPFDLPNIVEEGRDVICGYVHVLEDHAAPNGPTIQLAIAIVKDDSAAHQDDPLIVLSGGPGQKTIQQAFDFARIIRPYARNRDVILFDQRGVGFSEPALDCPEYREALFATLDEADPVIAGETHVGSLLDCADRLVSEGHNLAAYTTAQSAADVDDIRRALGYEQVNLYGGSYGSLLAQAVMRDHPDNIRSVLIDSVVPIEKSLCVDTATNAANAILHLVDACAADASCNAAYPDLKDALFDAIDRLNADPLPIIVTDPRTGDSYGMALTGDSIRDNLFTFLYDTSIIPILPQAIYDVYHEDYALMTQLSSARLARFDRLSTGMELSVLCTDDLIGRTPADFVSQLESIPPQLAGRLDPEAAVQFSFFGLCEEWPVEEADPSIKDPLVSDIPTLVLAGEFDPITPPAYARLVASYLPNSYLFEFPGIGHGVVGSGPCAQAIVRAFLDDPTTAPDAGCMADLPGVVFDLPGEETADVVMESVVYEQSGFQGVVPAGWAEPNPMNYRRGTNALDVTLFAQDAVPLSADDLRDLLTTQLGATIPEPVATGEYGVFTWNLYTFTIQTYATDLAIAVSDNPAYFVLLVTDPVERDALYEQVFLPAVEALAPLD
jgi:pimeloyl-ACP methyl ester carboxylesterase